MGDHKQQEIIMHMKAIFYSQTDGHCERTANV